MAGAVDEGGDRVGGHFFGGEGLEESFELLGFIGRVVEPEGKVVGSNDDGHAIVDGFHQVVGGGGEDSAGFDDGFVRGMPALKETGKDHGGLVAEVNEVRLFAPIKFLPFEEAVGGDQAAMGFIGAAESGFFGNGLGAGVNHAVADGGILGPGRYQTPTEHFQDVPGRILGLHHRRHRLRRGDIVAGFQGRNIIQLEEFS